MNTAATSQAGLEWRKTITPSNAQVKMFMTSKAVGIQAGGIDDSEWTMATSSKNGCGTARLTRNCDGSRHRNVSSSARSLDVRNSRSDHHSTRTPDRQLRFILPLALPSATVCHCMFEDALARQTPKPSHDPRPIPDTLPCSSEWTGKDGAVRRRS
jgi:hypothetical protein